MSTNSQYALISWLEDDSYSIVSARKILSPSNPVAGATCTVKNYEHCLTRVLAVGTESEMDRRLMQVVEADKFTALPTPKKKRRASLPFLLDTATSERPSAQQRALFQPEPDSQWYMHALTPHKPRQPRARSTHSDTNLIKDTGEGCILLFPTYITLVLLSTNYTVPYMVTKQDSKQHRFHSTCTSNTSAVGEYQ